ncbi:CHAD domain-containing protein [Pelagibacterium xiamenense]|uniref:CHAD domain-containing protein n=1 Tax=Pelagibacterium xiamenense TaxID=2901140 RepID=UPI001E37BC69|nr:CHAD domain-containing protein [Pelagibacterium xiamenense]MCD7058756.1 CHAD domain-containing protein [Pelagibacterium xiamenense]
MRTTKKASYRLAGKRPLDADTVIVARGQIDRMIEDLRDTEGPLPERVHDVRKGLKRMRGLLRVVRYADEDFYRAENARYRDIARDLAPLREAGARDQLIGALKDRFAAQLGDEPFPGVERALAEIAPAEHAGAEGVEDLLARTEERLGEGAFALSSVNWSFTPRDSAGALADGVAKIIKTLRKSQKTAHAAPSPENLHEWRKAVKYTGFATRLLKAFWPGDEKRIRKDLKAAGEILGLIHDIDEFARLLADERPGPDDERLVLNGLFAAWRSQLVDELDPLMDAVLALSPKKTGAHIADAYRKTLVAPAKT